MMHVGGQVNFFAPLGLPQEAPVRSRTTRRTVPAQKALPSPEQLSAAGSEKTTTVSRSGLWRWLRQGMPLVNRMNEEERVQTRQSPPKERLLTFLRRRKLFAWVLGASMLPIAGGAFMVRDRLDRVFPVAPAPIMERAHHPEPWQENVKVFASVPQADVSPNFRLLRKGGIFTTTLMNELKRSNSLEQAFQQVEQARYGEIFRKHTPVQSPEGPSIFNKQESKSRVAVLILGGSVGDSGVDMYKDLEADILRVNQTLQKQYGLTPTQSGQPVQAGQSLILDQPSVPELKQALASVAAVSPEEVLIYIVGEGAALADSSVPAPWMQHEGGKMASFDLNLSSSLNEQEFKALIHGAFPRGTSEKNSDIAIVADFCGSGALVQ